MIASLSRPPQRLKIFVNKKATIAVLRWPRIQGRYPQPRQTTPEPDISDESIGIEDHRGVIDMPCRGFFEIRRNDLVILGIRCSRRNMRSG